ncbi:MAG TPA: metal ABC transporter ATP-binding protein [Candidatus Babeliales bacterium]|nr:metal ABC transporter ATP-binding protein [Candidatus Babeliales bacterium]
MNSCAITLNNLTVAYNNKPVLWNITAEIPQGVILGIIGPNGAGKSTLIKSILDLTTPVSGHITILGGSYEQHRHKIAYVPQRSTVDWDFPATVLDVVLMGRYGRLGWFKRPTKIDIDAALHALDQVGLLSHANHAINNLSGGQQQRIFLARALLQDATLYLLDEPFIGVDTTTEKTTMSVLKTLRDAGKTIILVHHNLQTVRHYFDWLFLLNIEKIACGSIDDVFVPDYISATYGTDISLHMQI